MSTSDSVDKVQSPPDQASRPMRSQRRRSRHWRGGNSVIAHGEPMLWLTGSGLIICLTMIALLLSYVVVQGLMTFWPVPLQRLNTVANVTYLGEMAAEESYSLDYSSLDTLTGPTQDAAAKLLHPRLVETLAEWERQFGSAQIIDSKRSAVGDSVLKEVGRTAALRNATGDERSRLLTELKSAIGSSDVVNSKELSGQLKELAVQDPSGQKLFDLWQQSRQSEDAWLSTGNLAGMVQNWVTDADVRRQVWTSRWFAMLATDISVMRQRRLLRTGNFELTNEHFTWVNDFEINPNGQSYPEWAVIIERMQWGRFYGTPKTLIADGQTTASTAGEVWRAFERHLPEIRGRWLQARRLERDELGRISYQQEQLRLQLREIELQVGRDDPQWEAAAENMQAETAKLEKETNDLRERIQAVDSASERYQLVMSTADGQEKSIPLSEIVRAYPANRLSWWDKLVVYSSRWWEFLSQKPREANSEGGVLPAIFGTVAMTLMMTAMVVPFGVLAALYLREYARAGIMVRIVRIAVNNLAGVPSIVFGVFGLGFFCYIIGASIDQTFFHAKLPSPTLGTGGLLWSALTLSLLTLPVVIVATEEALAAVPNSLREGSYACGASKWQTIRRIVLPHAMPGIMTGMILAMARGAGEVAPLMLVGAVKIADELPVDGYLPFVHLERSFMHLGFHIYDLGFQSANSEAAKPMVLTTTLLLILVIAILNIAAVALRSRLRKQLRVGHF